MDRDNVAGVRLLSTQEFAEALGVSRRLVQRLIQNGEVAAVRVSPKLWRIKNAELARFIESRTVEVARAR